MTGKVIVEVEYREGVNTKPLRITTPIAVVHYADGTVLSYHTFDPPFSRVGRGEVSPVELINGVSDYSTDSRLDALLTKHQGEYSD